MKRTWPDINSLAVFAFIAAVLRGFWRKNQGPSRSNVLQFKPQTSILEQGQKQAGELATKVTTDGKSVAGEASVKVGGESWWLRFVGKVLAERDKKPDVEASVEFQKRWFGGW